MAEDRKDVPYDAPWTDYLKHRPDPNHVRSLQTPTPGHFTPRPPAAAPIPADPATLHMGRTPPAPGSAARRHDPQAVDAEPSYYDISPLKQPVWKWQIASYFFFGGLSGGAYALGRAAERGGGEKYSDLTQASAYLALAALLPCPPLLIWDLGDPKRFHHMLRVWKPSTPMNLGTWSIVAYSGMAAFEAVRQYLTYRGRHVSGADRNTLLAAMNNSVLLAVHDAVGVPFALMVAGYTGVLLSCTSNPLWCKNPYLGPLFSASAVSTGAEALSLTLDCVSRDSAAQSILQRVDTVAHVAELLLMRGFMRFAGEKAKPLTDGKYGKYHKFTMGALIGAEVLKLIPAPKPLRRPKRMLVSALGLAAGFALRWSMVFAGHEAAADPHTARLVSRPDDPSKRIGGGMRGAGGRLAHGHRR